MDTGFHSEHAASVALGVIILVAITCILAILVLLLFHLPNFVIEEKTVPAIFKITQIQHVYKYGSGKFDSYMVVMNTATISYDNQDLYAKTYRNGVLLNCAIPTLNGYDFIHGTHHYDVKNLKSEGKTWYAGATVGIDYEDKTFHPGDSVTFEVYDHKTKEILSRHTFRA